MKLEDISLILFYNVSTNPVLLNKIPMNTLKSNAQAVCDFLNCLKEVFQYQLSNRYPDKVPVSLVSCIVIWYFSY